MTTVRYMKFLYRGELPSLRVSSVSEETVVGRVWDHPVKPGLRFGQMIHIPMCDILDDCGMVQLKGSKLSSSLKSIPSFVASSADVS